MISNADSVKPFEQTAAGSRVTVEYKDAEFAFRYCPSGDYIIGSPEDEKGRYTNEVQRKVKIRKGFWVCETPITQFQWDTAGYEKAKECRFKGAKLPVENVNWKECVAFIQRLNELEIAPDGWRFALPTEEQWEYACRAGTTGSTYGVPLDDCAWFWRNIENATHEVGTKEPNKWGIFDMLGNVYELTSTKSERGMRIARGGCWGGSLYPYNCRPAFRCSFCMTSVYDNLGFRCVLIRS